MKVKLALIALLAFLVFVFVTQNTDMVQVTFLVWSIEISLVLLVFMMFLAGIAIGWLLNSYLRFSRSRKRQLAEQKPPGDAPVDEQGQPSSVAEDTAKTEEEKQA